LGFSLVLAGCGGGDDEDPNNGWTCVGGCSSEGVTAVNNDVRAGRLASAIGQAAHAAVPTGTFTGRAVAGLSGTATYSGHATSSSGSCGTDCVSRTTDVKVTVVFSGYRVKVASNQELTLTGTASLTDNTWSRQNGLSYSSGGSMTVSSTRLVARDAITDANGQVWGESDTIALSTGSAGGSNWSGSMVPSNGVTYSF
jgi:hypothetical protein